MDTMRAVILREFDAPLELVERPRPTADGDDASVIKVLACGLCHSDLHIVEHYFGGTPLPLVLGHEVAGELPSGERVLVYTPWGCGGCEWCREGHEAICPDSREAGIISDGGYADYMLVPHRRYLLPLGDLDPVQAAPLTCGGVTAYRGVKHVQPFIRKGDRVAVIGAGGLGQYAIQTLRMTTDAEVIAIDPSPAKRARAVELGASAGVAPGELDGKVRAVIDFVGADATVREAAALVNRKGIVVVAGLFGGTIPVGFGAFPHEARFMTTVWGSIQDLAELIGLAQRDGIQHTVETMPLVEAQAAHDRLRAGDVQGRIVLVP